VLWLLALPLVLRGVGLGAVAAVSRPHQSGNGAPLVARGRPGMASAAPGVQRCDHDHQQMAVVAHLVADLADDETVVV